MANHLEGGSDGAAVGSCAGGASQMALVANGMDGKRLA